MNGRRPNWRGVARGAVLAALALTAAVAVAPAARATGAATNARPWGSARGENAPSGPGLSPPQRFTVQVNGHPLAVWARIPLTARGAVLLVHGRTWSGRPDFDLDVPGLHRSVLEALETRGFAAYALDMRGYGETPRDATGWLTPRRAAADVLAVLTWMAARHPALPRPALLGWSTGAAVVHLTAATSPTRLSALILVGYAPDPKGVIAPVAGPAVPLKQRNTRAGAASDFISPKVTPPVVVRAFVDTAVRTDPTLADWRNEEQFICDSSRVSVPTLVMYGERDPNIDVRDAGNFFAGLATLDKQLVVFPGADHCAHLENTHDAWVSAVVTFLNRYAVSGR
jgi:alpha-beta hydrolase superfamily lysophospholipase